LRVRQGKEGSKGKWLAACHRSLVTVWSKHGFDPRVLNTCTCKRGRFRLAESRIFCLKRYVKDGLFARFGRWGEAAADGVLGDGAGDNELEEIIAAAGLAADARHFEAAEGLAIDEGTGDGAVEVEVADGEIAFGAVEGCGAAAVDAAGEGVIGGVGDAECFP